MSPDWLKVLHGDCRDVLPTLDAGSVHCVVTSPPYFGLRDYGTASWDGGDPACDHVERALRPSAKSTLQDHGDDGRSPQLDALPGIPYRSLCGKCGAVRQDQQIGLEPTPEAYTAALVNVFREVRRVLRDDGVVFLNLGDSYVSNGFWPDAPSNQGGAKGLTRGAASMSQRGRQVTKSPGLKPKDLVGIPWRVAFALQADGWFLRSDIIWSKPNPMPESVTDRPTKSHEYVFLLSKSARYWYDADAVREPHVRIWDPAALNGSINARTRDAVGIEPNPAGRNLRSVWTIATQPYPGAHFATFPPKLVEPCILAGCPDKVCAECGTALESPHDVPVQTVRQELRSAPFPGGSDEVLRSGLPLRGAPSEAEGLPRVRYDVPAEGRPEPLLWDAVREPGDVAHEGDHEGLRQDDQGLHSLVPAGSSDGAQERLRPGAPVGDGRGTGPAVAVDGGRGPHQRSEGRQPPREPSSDDEDGSRRVLEPRAAEDGNMPGLRESLPATGQCRQCGADLSAPGGILPGVVLDCFAGTGTALLVANKLSRRAIGIDLSGEYLEQLATRNQQTPLGLVG